MQEEARKLEEARRAEEQADQQAYQAVIEEERMEEAEDQDCKWSDLCALAMPARPRAPTR